MLRSFLRNLENKKLNGIIVVNKEKDWTSFDVVAKLRGIFREKRIGHGGTLDPMATGVLPVFVGKAARACDILPNETKAYTAGFQLGVTTDTLDVTGRVLKTRTPEASFEQVKEAAESFTGEIMQIPPMYSAVKINGKKLCNLAREGVVVERPARPVTVYSVEVTEFDEKTASGIMKVSCKKGTYIRSIIDDMGERLGCGAVMTSLIRTSSAGFDIKNSYTVSQIEELFKNGGIDKALTDVSKAFDSVYKSEVRLDERLTSLYKNGVKLSLFQKGMTLNSKGEDEIMLAYGSDGEFLGLCTADRISGQLKSLKNFY